MLTGNIAGLNSWSVIGNANLLSARERKSNGSMVNLLCPIQVILSTNALFMRLNKLSVIVMIKLCNYQALPSIAQFHDRSISMAFGLIGM
ncbi:hypothetical protein AAKU67_001745 [Oxalobacteraceae bacterium GrIS 2.11]